MGRLLRLPCEPLVGATEAVIELPHASVSKLALELSLLLDGLSDGLRVQANAGASIVLTLADAEIASKARVSRGRGGTVCFGLGRNQAEYLHAVLLRAYRDGRADVSHVHVEGFLDNEPFDLTMVFELFQEPMAPDAAERLMHD